MDQVDDIDKCNNQNGKNFKCEEEMNAFIDFFVSIWILEFYQFCQLKIEIGG